jgi:hypothetical protein
MDSRASAERPPLRRRAFALAAAGVVLLAAAAGCEDDTVPVPCSNVPAGGCPLSHGVACGDPSCLAVYACRANNVWELVERCPERADAGRSPVEAGAAADAAPPPPSFDASIDAPPGAFGGPGCSSLQAPDCAAGLALSCGSGCCGCEDLFVCESGAWELWGTCGDGGAHEAR